jgi:L-ribulose-5-phosphate 3-epimerase
MIFVIRLMPGHDTIKEFKQLGRQNICELHMKENGFLLDNGTLPWPQIRDLVYEMGYYGDGWMQIEWAMPENADVVASYKHNLKFLRAHTASTLLSQGAKFFVYY